MWKDASECLVHYKQKTVPCPPYAGLVKKVIVADYISGNFIDRVFDNPTMFSGFENLMAVYGFTLRCHRMRLYLPHEIFGPYHRTGQKRREKGKEKCVVQKIACRFYVSAIYVYNVAYGAECEK